MRVLHLLAVLCLAAPALAPPAAACHPPLVLHHEVSGHGAHVVLDMGCSHLPPWRACALVWTPAGHLGWHC